MIAHKTLAGRARAARLARFGEDGVPALAELLGLPVATWRNYERGVAMPAVVVLMLIDRAGVRPAFLLRGEGPALREG